MPAVPTRYRSPSTGEAGGLLRSRSFTERCTRASRATSASLCVTCFCACAAASSGSARCGVVDMENPCDEVLLPDVGVRARNLSNDDCRDRLEAAARDAAHLHHTQPQIA